MEIVIVIGLLFVILSIAVPYGLRFFSVERLNGASREILETLRHAQSGAMSQSFDAKAGIYIQQGSFTFFRGDSYLERDSQYDQIYYLPTQINFSGLDEVVFDKLTGLSSQTGEIILENGGRENIIRINNQGLISLDLNVTIGTP